MATANRNIIVEVLHWMHQRGDTVGATRLKSAKRWKFAENFERPIVANVFVIDVDIGHSGIMEIRGNFLNYQDTDTVLYRSNSQFRVRIYNSKICQFYYFNGELKTIGDIKSLSSMFSRSAFNKPLILDTSEVVDFSQMFYECSEFNQPLHWDMRSAENVSYIFYRAYSFNQTINWYTPKLRYICRAFSMAFNMSAKVYLNTKLVNDNDNVFYGIPNRVNEIEDTCL